MVTIDLLINVVSGTGSAPFPGPLKFQTLAISPIPTGVTYDHLIQDDLKYGVGSVAGNQNAVTFLQEVLKTIPTLPRGGTFSILNATKDGVYPVRIYSEPVPTSPVQR